MTKHETSPHLFPCTTLYFFFVLRPKRIFVNPLHSPTLDSEDPRRTRSRFVSVVIDRHLRCSDLEYLSIGIRPIIILNHLASPEERDPADCSPTAGCYSPCGALGCEPRPESQKRSYLLVSASHLCACRHQGETPVASPRHPLAPSPR